MIYAIIAGIVILIVFSVWYTKKVDNSSNLSNSQENSVITKIETTEDNPIGFGYKCMWLAIKAENQQKVAELIGIKDPKKSNWESGIDNAYEGSIFITPSIDGWTLAVGLGLPSGDSKESLEQVKIML